MLNLSSMTMTKNIEELIHNGCSSFFTYTILSLEHIRKWFAITKFHDYEVMMIVFKKLIDFIYIGMINKFKFINLSLQSFSLICSDFVFVNYIDRSNKFSFQMDSFAKLIKLILLETWWQNFITLVNWTLYFTNKIILFELYLLFLFVDILSWLLLHRIIFWMTWSHYFSLN